METAIGLCDASGLPVHVVDRPSFPPWRTGTIADTSLRRITDIVPETQITRKLRVSLPAALLSSRKASGPIVEQVLNDIAQCYDSLLVIDFDPFAEITAPANATHWFDEIDDFSKHRRMPGRDRRAFAAKRARGHAIHTASSLESTVGDSIPNWVFTPIAPTAEDGCTPYEFGYIGYVDNKIDIDLVARLAAVGPMGIWGNILDAEVERKLSEIPGISLMGEFCAPDLQGIMAQFRIGVIPFLLDRIHGNSPIKYYQYSAAHKPCLSTSAFGLKRDNLLVIDAAGLGDALARVPMLDAAAWSEVTRQNNQGKDLFEARLKTEIERMP
ncbi:hypothetical protein ACFSUD_19035 [Sulfitobacter aestuarii]|uniref:Glycosyltransferase family 1 protein n=1 Tax=Sulfitobacter aestuarii TaxID=2161676 RepID=A0ABW5U8P7_9RHOB